MTSDIVRLPGGRVMTRSRANALGLLDAAGNVKSDVPQDSVAAKVLRQDARAAEWAKSQGLPAPTARTSVQDIRMTADGRMIASLKIEPLRPQNVDKSGQAVTDEETLAAIAAETADIEAAKANEVQTPAQKRLATMAANKAAREAAAEGLGTGTPVEESSSLPSGDARVESLDIGYGEFAVTDDALKGAKSVGEFKALGGVLPDGAEDLPDETPLEFLEGSDVTMRFLRITEASA